MTTRPHSARQEAEALQKLADATGNYLLWAPREKGHAAAHQRLWDAYREYEAAFPLTVSSAPPEGPRGART